MRSLILRFVLLAATASLVVNCSKSTNATTPPSNATNISAELIASKWGVQYFFYNSNDQTKQFSGYVFTFKKDSTLEVANTTESYHGGWYTQKQSDNSILLAINIASLTQIQLLGNNWKVTSNDGTLMVLKDNTGMTDKIMHLSRQ